MDDYYIVSNIQHIYNSLNIHKAIFVYNNDFDFCKNKSKSLYHLLNLHLFPIGLIKNMQHVISFINNKKRILLVDYVDMENIDLLAKEYEIDLKEINLIIFIKPLQKVTIKKYLFSSNLHIEYV